MNYKDLKPGDRVMITDISSTTKEFQNLVEFLKSLLPGLPTNGIVSGNKGILDVPIVFLNNGEQVSLLYLQWEKLA